MAVQICEALLVLASLPPEFGLDNDRMWVHTYHVLMALCVLYRGEVVIVLSTCCAVRCAAAACLWWRCCCGSSGWTSRPSRPRSPSCSPSCSPETITYSARYTHTRATSLILLAIRLTHCNLRIDTINVENLNPFAAVKKLFLLSSFVS